MQKARSFLKKFSVFILGFVCLSFCACNQWDSTDLVEKGGYPRAYPDLSPKSAYPSLEKPDVEEEFFEADKH